jgi:hypothetical protein
MQDEDLRRAEKRLGRGLEDVSSIFLSLASDKQVDKARTENTSFAHSPEVTADSRIPVLLSPSEPINRESMISLLNQHSSHLEEGTRAIDSNIPCPPFGAIDLLALGCSHQVSVIKVDIRQNDLSLIQGIAQVDWILRNKLIIQRICPAETIELAIPPRLLLVAPDFSPLLRCVVQRIVIPKVICFEYRTVSLPDNVGVFFKCI